MTSQTATKPKSKKLIETQILLSKILQTQDIEILPQENTPTCTITTKEDDDEFLIVDKEYLDIPAHILFLVFPFLTSRELMGCRGVCKAWRFAVEQQVKVSEVLRRNLHKRLQKYDQKTDYHAPVVAAVDVGLRSTAAVSDTKLAIVPLAATVLAAGLMGTVAVGSYIYDQIHRSQIEDMIEKTREDRIKTEKEKQTRTQEQVEQEYFWSAKLIHTSSEEMKQTMPFKPLFKAQVIKEDSSNANFWAQSSTITYLVLVEQLQETGTPKTPVSPVVEEQQPAPSSLSSPPAATAATELVVTSTVTSTSSSSLSPSPSPSSSTALSTSSQLPAAAEKKLKLMSKTYDDFEKLYNSLCDTYSSSFVNKAGISIPSRAAYLVYTSAQVIKEFQTFLDALLIHPTYGKDKTVIQFLWKSQTNYIGAVKIKAKLEEKK